MYLISYYDAFIYLLALNGLEFRFLIYLYLIKSMMFLTVNSLNHSGLYCTRSYYITDFVFASYVVYLSRLCLVFYILLKVVNFFIVLNG